MAGGSNQDLRFPDLTKRRFDWQKWLGIAAIGIPLAIGALYLYRNIRAEMTPGEGDLIVNVNTATQDELETIPGIGPYTVKSIAPYVKVTGETEKR